MDRLRCFLGKRPLIVDNVELYSPTINQIDEIGEVMYHVYLNLAIFDKETIFTKLFGVSEEEYKQVEEMDSFEALTLNQNVINYISRALSFFTRSDVAFDYGLKSFKSNETGLINQNNYLNIVKAVKYLNGMQDKLDNKNIRGLRTEKARAKLKELQEIRRKYAKNTGLELKDILSILCNADGNGINIFNVGELTIYQVYEQFERLNVKENHLRVLKVWANGLLKENAKLPEWIIKTKF